MSEGLADYPANVDDRKPGLFRSLWSELKPFPGSAPDSDSVHRCRFDIEHLQTTTAGRPAVLRIVRFKRRKDNDRHNGGFGIVRDNDRGGCSALGFQMHR